MAAYRSQGAHGSALSAPPSGAPHVGYQYDRAGKLRHVTDPKGQSTEYEYNGRGLVERITPPAAQGQSGFESRSYDVSGNLLSITDLSGSQTSFTYDSSSRILSRSFAGETTSVSYDAAGNVESVTEPGGQSGGDYAGSATEYQYDAFNRVERVTDPMGIYSRYAYDDVNLTDIWGPAEPGQAERHTHFEYDNLGRLTSKNLVGSGAQSQATHYANFDADGHPRQVTDPNDNALGYVYDRVGRVETITVPPSDDATWQLQQLDYDYYPNGLVSAVHERKLGPSGVATESTLYERDPVFNRLMNLTQRDHVTTFSYDDNGNRTLLRTTQGETGYTYDARDRLSTASIAGGTVNYDYTNDGRLDAIRRPNGVNTQYEYLPNRRVQSIAHSMGGTELAYSEYAYDDSGNPTAHLERLGGQAVLSTHDYDASGRMRSYTEFQPNGSGGWHPTAAKTYDYLGYDRRQETEDRFPDGSDPGESEKYVSTTYDYDGYGRLEGTWSASASVTQVNYGYDSNGNVTSRTEGAVTTAFAFDALDRLVRATSTQSGETLTLGRYDSNYQGLRTRHYDSERGDVETFYVGGSAIEERTPAGSLIAHHHKGVWTAATTTPDGVSWPSQDALGTNIALTDANGALEASYRVDPWGNLKNDKAPGDTNNRIFTGHEHDERTGLIYAKGRYLDPKVGRFISADSYPGTMGDAASQNRYTYARNNPGKYVDPSGHVPMTVSTYERWSETSENWYTRVESYLDDTDNYGATEQLWNVLPGRWEARFEGDVLVGYRGHVEMGWSQGMLGAGAPGEGMIDITFETRSGGETNQGEGSGAGGKLLRSGALRRAANASVVAEEWAKLNAPGGLRFPVVEDEQGELYDPSGWGAAELSAQLLRKDNLCEMPGREWSEPGDLGEGLVNFVVTTPVAMAMTPWSLSSPEGAARTEAMLSGMGAAPLRRTELPSKGLLDAAKARRGDGVRDGGVGVESDVVPLVLTA